MSIIFYGDYSEDQLIKCLSPSMQKERDVLKWQLIVEPIVHELKGRLALLPDHIDIVGVSDVLHDKSHLSVLLFR